MVEDGMTSDLTVFRAALEKGSGRAMTLLRGDDESHVAALFDACAVNLAHDPQCEEPRAPYLARLIAASGQLEKVYLNLLEVVEAWGDEEETGLWHPLSVLTALAAAHEDLDRTRLTAVIRGQEDEDDRLDLADLLIRLEGFPALIEALGLLAPQFDEDGWMADSWLTDLRLREGEAIEPVLEAARKTNPVLDRALVGRSEDARSRPIEPEPFESLREALRAKQQTRWGPRVTPRSEAERLLLAEDLASLDEAWRALPYLRFFARQPLPGDPRALLRWRNDNDPKVRHFSRMAMEQVDHWAVRAVAVEGLRALQPWSVGLLKSNYRPGDYALVVPVIDSEITPHEAHSLVMDVLAVREKLAPDERHDALVKAYDKTPCSYCRRDVVRSLHEAGQLPRWMAEECRYDADPETVALVSG